MEQAFRVPLAPIVGGCVIFGATFFLWQLGKKTVINSSIFLGASALVYLVYGIHAAERHDEAMIIFRQEL